MALVPGSVAPALDELRTHCAPHLADYKLPKAIVVVPEIVRSPNGKPDYEWAKRAAGVSAVARLCPLLARKSGLLWRKLRHPPVPVISRRR